MQAEFLYRCISCIHTAVYFASDPLLPLFWEVVYTRRQLQSISALSLSCHFLGNIAFWRSFPQSNHLQMWNSFHSIHAFTSDIIPNKMVFNGRALCSQVKRYGKNRKGANGWSRPESSSYSGQPETCKQDLSTRTLSTPAVSSNW